MFCFYNQSEEEQVAEGVSRRVLVHGGKIMSVEVTFQQGAIGPLHRHPHEQLTYVRSGRFRFTIGDETHEVVAGDTLYKQPDILHGCVCWRQG